MDKFCELPEDKKTRYKIDPPNDNQGYVAPGVERYRFCSITDLPKESACKRVTMSKLCSFFRFNRERQKEARHSYNILSFERKIPEEELPGFEETVSLLAQEFKRVASLILQIIAVGLGK